MDKQGFVADLTKEAPAGKSFIKKDNRAYIENDIGSQPQDWTPKYVMELVIGARAWDKAIADAHKAALAAAIEANNKWWRERTSSERVFAEQLAGKAALAACNEVVLLRRIRDCLTRWAARFAFSPHAAAHVKESRLLIQEINERLGTIDR
jgi:hypothetical protein